LSTYLLDHQTTLFSLCHARAWPFPVFLCIFVKCTSAKIRAIKIHAATVMATVAHSW
jgi:hypothetical protein